MKNPTMKRLLTFLVALALMLLPAMAMASDYATVKGGGLNLREQPNLNAKVLGQFWTGTWVEILEKGDTWCKVQVGGKTGYMMTKFLSTGASAATLYVRTNTGIGLNLRKAPSTTAEIITSYPINTAVQVIKKGTGWHQVKVGDNEGYMASQYLFASKAPSYTSKLDTPYKATLKNINGGSVVNFRLYPGMKTKVLQQLPVGTEVTVLEKGVNWSLVELADGAQGYVSTYFLVKK